MTQITGALGLGPEQVSALLDAARRAPSSHNTQPWRFRLTPATIELHADIARRLPVADPDDTEMRLACGAALFNLRIALLGAGIRPTVSLLPDPEQPQLIAAVRHGGHKPLTPEIERLLRVVPLRHTNRHPFTDVAVALPEQYALRRAALEEGAWLHIVNEPDQRTELRTLAMQAHEGQMADPAFRQELEEPLIAVLTSHFSGCAADVQAGQALQRVLLTAAADGLSVSYLSQIVEVPAIRDSLRRLIGGTRPPQVVLRIGRGWPVPATPRRPIADLVLPAPATSVA